MNSPGRRGTNHAVVATRDIEQHILSMLPRGFPVLDPRTGLRYGEALFVMPRGLFNKKGSPCMFEAFDYHQMMMGLGRNAKAGSVSVFRRTGLDPDNRLAIGTHQFRHYLNTLAQAGGLSQIDIAKWSGRVNAAENASYDHVSSEEIIARGRAAATHELTQSAGIARSNEPVARNAFRDLDMPTGHVTLYGFCAHDFVETPCELFRRRLDCQDHVCIKGDIAKTERIRQVLIVAERHLALAKAAASDEIYGANAWVETHSATVARITQLLAILDDASLPQGSRIKVGSSGVYTLTEAALQDRLGSPQSGPPFLEAVYG